MNTAATLILVISALFIYYQILQYNLESYLIENFPSDEVSLKSSGNRVPLPARFYKQNIADKHENLEQLQNHENLENHENLANHENLKNSENSKNTHLSSTPTELIPIDPSDPLSKYKPSTSKTNKFELQYDKKTWEKVKIEREEAEKNGELDLTKWENIISWNGFVKRKYKGKVERIAFLKKFVDPDRNSTNVDDLAYLRLDHYRALAAERAEKNLDSFLPFLYEKISREDDPKVLQKTESEGFSEETPIPNPSRYNNCNHAKDLEFPDISFAGINLSKLWKLNLKPGGLHIPCNHAHNSGHNYTDSEILPRGKQSNAILIAYRNREAHLQQFIPFMHLYLQKTHPDLVYQIFVMEQTNDWKFNRAMLFNMGINWVEKNFPAKFGCFTFTDVDSIPETGKCSYYCPRGKPTEYNSFPAVHVAGRRSKWEYNQPNFPYFGGITVMDTRQLLKINGNPNRFYGWGGEDSALRARLDHHKINVGKADYGCTVLVEAHFRDKGNEVKYKSNRADIKLEKEGDNTAKNDGLTSLKEGVSHDVVKVDYFDTFTKVRVKFLKCMIPEVLRSEDHDCEDAMVSNLS